MKKGVEKKKILISRNRVPPRSVYLPLSLLAYPFFEEIRAHRDDVGDADKK